MELGLSGKNAVVTGASKGIGLAITKALVDEGVYVVAGARDRGAELDALGASGSVRLVEGDLSAPTGPVALIAAALERGGIDILVNNVGAVSPRLGGFLEVAAGHGTIVSICSVNAILPDPAVIDYSAAKAALLSFSKSLSNEVADLVLLLASDRAGNVTGADFVIDGGLIKTM